MKKKGKISENKNNSNNNNNNNVKRVVGGER